MENRQSTPAGKPKIAIIVLYFGPLPPYFPVWLKSAEANPDVDFLVWSDREIYTDAPNFHVWKCTLKELQERFSQTLNRPLEIPNGYKLCDYRPAYGLLFAEELRGYDFWGHCDIDLVFGQIRRFLTDEVLGAYDRFYGNGPLSVYRNSEKMNHAFELPGSWFTLDEMFAPIHIGMDETAGINHICWKNHIPWYLNTDSALLSDVFKMRLEIGSKQQPNYPIQTFYWLDGRAFQRYVDAGEVKEREMVYVHWYRRRPIPERVPVPGEAVVVTPEQLLIRPPQDLTPENMLRWNPPVRVGERFFETQRKRAKGYWLLFTGTPAVMKIRWKFKCFGILKRRLKKYPYP